MCYRRFPWPRDTKRDEAAVLKHNFVFNFNQYVPEKIMDIQCLSTSPCLFFIWEDTAEMKKDSRASLMGPTLRWSTLSKGDRVWVDICWHQYGHINWRQGCLLKCPPKQSISVGGIKKKQFLSYLSDMGLVYDAQGMQQDLKTSIQIGGTARDLSSTTIWGRPESMAGESVPNP